MGVPDEGFLIEYNDPADRKIKGLVQDKLKGIAPVATISPERNQNKRRKVADNDDANEAVQREILLDDDNDNISSDGDEPADVDINEDEMQILAKDALEYMRGQSTRHSTEPDKHLQNFADAII